MNNFQHLHDFSNTTLAYALNELREHAELWDNPLGNLRASYPGSAQRDTRAIIMRWCPRPEESFTSLDLVRLDPWYILSRCASLAEYIARMHGRPLARVLLAELRAGGRITPHIDEGAYAEATRRYHLALRADVGNEFRCGGETVEMWPNELWWFDHRQVHEVVNHSERPRVHLIVDIFL